MKRRTFFRTSVIGGTAMTFNAIPFCTQPAGEKLSDKKSINEFELNEFTIVLLQEKMASGEFNSVSVCQNYLDRIALVDPHLKSIIELNPDALTIAGEMDRERKSGKIRGPLHGIPVIIKDNIDTGDKMQTTAGSLALAGHIAQSDAPIVARLRDAGAVLIGKTNLSEWANFRSEMSSSGWSGRGGQVRNPYCLDRTPCGSSSGTAAAIAANLCAIGIGTETNGSIVCPSGINGIVGIKPTLGLWNGKGIVPIAHSQDTAGPMCRTVADAAILLGALAGSETAAWTENQGTGNIHKDYTPFLNSGGLTGKRLGIARDLLGFHPRVDEVFSKAVELMKSKGAEIIDNLKFERSREMGAFSYQVLLYEFKADLNKYLAEHPSAPVRSLEEIIAFNEAGKEKEMPWFGQDIFIAAQAKGDLSTEEYVKALSESKKISQDGINKVMDEQRLDAIIAATNGPAWSIDWINGDHFHGGSSSLAAISGYPNITVPMGFVEGLPIGISFWGRAWSEPILLGIAYAFEQSANCRKAPGFRETIG
jgi:amidase